MIYLFTGIYDDITLLPQFLHHYQSLGVDHVFLAVNNYKDRRMSHKVKEVAHGQPVTVAHEYQAPHSWVTQGMYRTQVMSSHMQPGDWALVADLDEFQEYPEALRGLLSGCEASGEDCVCGTMTDRVASDGSLPVLRADIPVSAQFPIGLPLTRQVLQAPVNKVVCIRGPSPLPRSCVTVAELTREHLRRVSLKHAIIHHYKWHAGVLAKLIERRDSYKKAFGQGNHSFANYRESERFLDYFEKKGRIDLSDFDVRQRRDYSQPLVTPSATNE